jgi:hypothetical protein
MTEATTRQRRNLMLTTSALILIFHAGMVFGDELKLFGASVKILNPNMLLNFLLIVHIYFLWRFYQYFYVDKAYTALKNQYKTALNNILDRVLMAHIFKSLPKGVTTIMGGSHTYTEVSRTDDRGGVYEVRVDYPGGRDDETLSDMVVVPKKIFRFKSLPVAIKFFFRGKIITDFYLPILLASYSLIINVVKQFN